MVGFHPNAANRRRLGIEELPTDTIIGASPETGHFGVYGFGSARIEREEAHRSPQVEHPPGTPGVMGDVGSRHIARNENRAAIVRADGGVVLCASSAGADHPKISGALGQTTAYH